MCLTTQIDREFNMMIVRSDIQLELLGHEMSVTQTEKERGRER